MNLSPRLRLITIPSLESKSIGGKGLGLSQAAKGRLPIPPTLAFSSFEIQALLNRLDGYQVFLQAVAMWSVPEGACPPEIERFESYLADLQEPLEWSEIIMSIQDKFKGPKKIIFRSSTSVEDGYTESFAGAFDSIICQPDAQQSWNAFKEVLASYYNAAAIKRILSAGQDPRDLMPSILVQPFIEGMFSGVAFSRNPLDIYSKVGLIEYSSGAGAKVVQGETPSQTLDQTAKAPLELAPFWSDLWSYCAKAEDILDCPADIEWTFDGKKLWILQIRPIASEVSSIVRKIDNGKLYSRELTEERFPNPVTPLGWTILEDSLRINLTSLKNHFGIEVLNPEDMAVSVSGTIYSDPQFLRTRRNLRISWRKLLPHFWFYLTRCTVALFRHLARRTKNKSKQVSQALLGLELLDTLLTPVFKTLNDSWSQHCAKYIEKNKAFYSNFAQVRTDVESRELLDLFTKFSTISLGFMEPDLPIYIMKTVIFDSLKKLWTAAGFTMASFLRVTDQFENKTLELRNSWRFLARELKKDPAFARFIKTLEPNDLRPRNRSLWQNFLSDYGHCRTSWDVAQPGWKENPSQLIGLLLADESALERTSKTEGESEEFFRLLTSQFGAQASELGRKWQMNLQKSMQMDEDHHFWAGMLLDTSRSLVHRAAEEFVDRGLIDNTGDIYFLEFDEIKKALGNPLQSTLKFLVAARRARFTKRQQPPFELSSKPRRFIPTALNDLQNGIAVSPGKVEGTIQFIETMEDLKGLTSEHIIATLSPNPAFVCAYSTCKGLLTQSGGPLAHGFVAAREVGLPAVSGLANLKHRFPSGMRVRIDGTHGTVEICGVSS